MSRERGDVNDGEMRRLLRDMEDVLQRLRRVEDFDTNVARGHLERLDRVITKVGEMDVHGTRVTQVKLQGVEDDIRDMKDALKTKANQKEVDTIVDQTASIRTFVRSTLASAAIAIGIAVLSFILNRGGN